MFVDCVVQVLLHKMRLSITTEAGQLLTIDVDAQMELENVKALLEADVGTKKLKAMAHIRPISKSQTSDSIIMAKNSQTQARHSKRTASSMMISFYYEENHPIRLQIQVVAMALGLRIQCHQATQRACASWSLAIHSS